MKTSNKIFFPIIIFSFIILTSCRNEISDLEMLNQNLTTSFANNSFTKYYIDFDIDYNNPTIAGHEKIIYTNNENTPLNKIYINRYINTNKKEKVKINNLTVNGVQKNLISYDNSLISCYIKLNKSLNIGDTITIDFDFSYSLKNYRNSLNIVQPNKLNIMFCIPLIGVFDNNKWIKRKHFVNGDYIFCDSSIFHYSINAPREMTIASNGIQTSKKRIKDNQYRYNYISGPSRDITIVGNKNMQLNKVNYNEISYNIYYYTSIEKSNEILEIAKKSIKLFNSKILPYPYKQLIIAPTPANLYGMEYSGGTVISKKFYKINKYYTPKNQFNDFSLTMTIVHELGHQWFFNILGGNQIDEPWIDEGGAQFLTYLYFKTYKPNELDKFYNGYTKHWDKAIKNNTKLSINKSSDDYNPIEYMPAIYGGALKFYVELSEYIGLNKFLSILGEFSKKNIFKTITGKDFLNFIQKNSDKDLSPIYNKYILK